MATGWCCIAPATGRLAKTNVVTPVAPITHNAMTDDFSAEPLGLPKHDSTAVSPSRETVEVLATQFIEAHRRGESPSIDDYALRHPEQAGEIHRLFPLVAAMEDWKSDKSTAANAAPFMRPLEIDRLGDCRIVREIGRGGMGVVFEAYQDPPGRRVAVKIFPWQHGPDSPWREQFAHEARLAARLRHANIVPVYQYSEQAGFSYYVMPLIAGVGLDWIIQRLSEDDGVVYADEIRRARAATGDVPAETPGAAAGLSERPAGEGPVPKGPAPDGSPTPHGPGRASSLRGRQLTRSSWKQIAKIGVQAAAALRYAHRQGLLHRDIKPGNVLLDADGVVWITDFGLARQITDVDESPDIVGTLRYMSPEHLVGSADERSDVYSLGVTLHELCTLAPAFQARTRSELKQAICRGDVIVPRTANPKLPVALEAIILKAVAADPQRRYQSADELKSDLLRFINGQPVTASDRRWLRRKRKPQRSH